mmetsp:Transcript_46520/g.118745  ORF Transcript_46520/g.118745 Transcript_46520/m.118745 type:complete len:409 (+) Transcript_46520:152-1378(+)|eukprot:jgi/Tetstr1/434238/TSEL_023348.t1
MALATKQSCGCPLYSAAWVSPSAVLMAGGGGKKSSGIKNKIVGSQVTERGLEPESAACDMGVTEFDVPYRLVLHPDRETGLVAMAGPGGCRFLDVSAKPKEGDKAEGCGISISVNEAKTATCKSLSKGVSVNRICFAGDNGDLVLLGMEDGRILVCHYPSLELKTEFVTVSEADTPSEDDKSIRDMDVAPKSSGPMAVVATDSGKAHVFYWATGEKLHTFPVPSALQRGRGYSSCRFARDTEDMFGEPNTVYAVVNAGGAGHMVAWRWAISVGATLQKSLEKGFEKATLATRKKIASDPITCFEICPGGRWIAAGTSEGDIIICRAGSLSKARVVKQAHGVFSTGLAWSPDSSSVLSVSGDNTAYLLAAPKPPGFLARPEVQLLLAMLFLLLAVLVPHLWKSIPEWME